MGDQAGEYTSNSLTFSEIKEWPKIEDVATLEYREYPYHITHYDPDHPDFIPDRKEDYYARIKTDKFNYYLDRLKSDLKI